MVAMPQLPKLVFTPSVDMSRLSLNNCNATFTDFEILQHDIEILQQGHGEVTLDAAALLVRLDPRALGPALQQEMPWSLHWSP